MPAFPAAEGRTPRRPEGHRLDARIFRRGRDDLRVVRLNASTRQQLSGLLSAPSGFSPGDAEPAHRGLDRQIGEHRHRHR